MPNLVDVSHTAELFATFANNPVVVCFVGAIFAAYLLVVVWARRKDIQDLSKVSLLSQCIIFWFRVRWVLYSLVQYLNIKYRLIIKEIIPLLS